MSRLAALIVLTLGFVSSLPAFSRGEELVVHVAVNGDDSYDGSTGSPAGAQSGPVRTLERARTLVRLARSNPSNHGKTVGVVIGGGVYELPAPLSLTAADSGDPGAPVVYRAAQGASVVLSGGRRVRGWKADPSGGFVTALEAASFGGACPSQLFVNGARRERPRIPADGSFLMDHPAPPSAGGRPIIDQFFARPNDIPADFQPDAGAEIVIFDRWTADRLRIASYDPTTNLVALKGAFLGSGFHKEFTAQTPYVIENAPVKRLAPGSWRCQVASRSILYQPEPGEKLDDIEAVAPRLTQIVVLHGTPSEPVHDIRFENISFRYAAWSLPPSGWAAMQAEVGLPAAIVVENAHSIAFSAVVVAHMGANAFKIGRGSSDIEIAKSKLQDLGGGGVAIGSIQKNVTEMAADSLTSDVRVIGNTITEIGRIQYAATGILSCQASHVLVKDNIISDLYYSGVSIGWNWNTGPSVSDFNVIEGNKISRFGQNLLSDFGGIYTLGRQNGTLVERNVISGGHARNYGGWGLYADAGSAGITFRGNTVSDTSHAAIHVNWGVDLLFEDNQVSGFGEAAVRCNQPSEGFSVSFRDNFANSSGPPATAKNCSDKSYSFENFVFTSNGHKEQLSKRFGETSFDVRDMSNESPLSPSANKSSP